MLAESGNPTEGHIFTSQTKNTKGKPLDTRRINEAIKKLAVKTFGEEKGKQFKTKVLRSFYNSALLRARVQPQELKDVMMGHKRLGARGHYAYDEFTIKEAYNKAFEYLSVNGIQSREDLAKLKEQIGKQDREIKAMRNILLSLIDREKLEQLIIQNLKDKPQTVAVLFYNKQTPQEAIKKLSDKELLELYYKTL